MAAVFYHKYICASASFTPRFVAMTSKIYIYAKVKMGPIRAGVVRRFAELYLVAIYQHYSSQKQTQYST